MASSYTALPTNDAFGFYYNPAQLGFFSQRENGSLQYMSVDWLPGFNFSDLSFKSFGGSFGFNLNNLPQKIPLSLGIGYMRGYLDLGKNVWTDEFGNELGTFNAREWYDAISLAACYTNYINASFGFTYKSIVSKLNPGTVAVGNESSNGVAKPKAFDVGLLFTLPIHRFYIGMFSKTSANNFKLLPVTNILE